MHLSHSVTLCPTLSHLTRLLVQEDWLRSFLTNFTYFLKYLCPNMLKKNDWMCCCRLSAFLVRFFLNTLCTFFSDGAWDISYFNFSSFSDQGHLRHMMDIWSFPCFSGRKFCWHFSHFSVRISHLQIYLPYHSCDYFLLDTSTDVLIFVYLYCVVFVLTPLVGVIHK